MCRFLNNLFTVTGNNNTVYSKNRIGNRNVHSKVPTIVFQINSISLMESEEFRETSITRSHRFEIFISFSDFLFKTIIFASNKKQKRVKLNNFQMCISNMFHVAVFISFSQSHRRCDTC